ncbi:ubiquitin-specific protease ubp2 [Lecanora helva]
MAGMSLGGGKTAPRLLQDLLLYDPRKLPPSGFNILTDIPVYNEEQGAQIPPPPRIGKGNCRHQWSLKPNQCKLGDDNYRTDDQTVRVLAAYCAICRSHLEMQLDFRGNGRQVKPCPADERPLHHFVYRPELSSPGYPVRTSVEFGDGSAWSDCRRFRCISLECGAELCIHFKPPRLTKDWVDLLTDRSIIKKRAEEAISDDPARFEGFAVPPPLDVLLHSKHYITNPLFNPGKSKKIQGHNKRFLLNVGEQCAGLLEYFGFTREGADWLPPHIEVEKRLPFHDQTSIRIDDAEKELLALISQISEEKQKTKQSWIPDLADRDFQGLLGCLDYQKSIRSRTADYTKNTQEHPFYAGLGAVEDFHDELLMFAYYQQLQQDHVNTPYYLECLQGIAEGRNSEYLQLKIAIEATSDKISRRDIRSAYKELDLHANEVYEDDTIIGTFNSRVTDAPKQEPEMRRALKIIGQDRSSEKIRVVASQDVNNYEQALSFLGATHETSDDFIPPMFAVKKAESHVDEATARRAVILVASHRNSQFLKNFLNTGQIDETDMDVDTAYARFDISERDVVDDELVLVIYNTRITDDPSQLDNLRKALAAIAKSRNSQRLNDFLHTGMISSDHPLSEWPVGLENIGNTCYLNSLLQFYFTIKPLREIVLKIDDYKMPTDKASLNYKRVGSRNVSAKEVLRAQSFVDELRKLFESMITSPKASVTPEPELARLTLLSSDKAEIIRRQSILSPNRPSLGEIAGQPILGPLGPPAPEENEDVEMSDTKFAEQKDNIAIDSDQSAKSDSSSDVTLVEGHEALEDKVSSAYGEAKSIQRNIIEDKENLSPVTEPIKQSSPEYELIPLGETSPSRVNEQTGPPSPAKKNEANVMELTEDIPDFPTPGQTSFSEKVVSPTAMPPKRSPPLPPRPKQVAVTTSNALQEAEVGAQQDVTEVIANFLFQLQCAIQAESVDETGEQIDRVKDLFFGKQKSYTTDKQGKTRTKEEYMSDIKVDVATGPRDIYAALDGAYDEQDVEVGGGVEPQYTSISVLPPVLQIHVQRSLYDREKKAAFKSTNHLELRETIYMDRYMDSSDFDLLERRRQCWRWKREKEFLEQRRDQLLNTATNAGLDSPSSLRCLGDYLRDHSSEKRGARLNFDPLLIQKIEAAAQVVSEELEIIENKLRDLASNIASQFHDLRRMPYSLQSVFVHRGYHNSGHYWIYIFDFVKGIWRKYNDGYVTEVIDKREIFAQEPGDRPATPYFLVYVKDEKKTALVDSVCREPIEPAQQEQDTVMADSGQILELPANEASAYASVTPQQELGVTDSYKSDLWVRGNADWDDTTRAAPVTGW